MRIGNGYINNKIGVIIYNHDIYSCPDLLNEFNINNTTDLIKNNDALEYLKNHYNTCIKTGIDKYGPAISNPEKIICVGKNYKEHALETGSGIPESPVLFSKFNNTLTGHLNDIIIDFSDSIDYEGELGIVIGKKARNVDENDAMDYVFGYYIANDVSARDLQYRTSQWLLGKIPDGFYPNGPFIVTKDEVNDPMNLDIRTLRNGDTVQHSNTRNMIFDIKYLIGYISKYLTLMPGDVISTGTPEGVILGTNEKNWIKNNETIEVKIEKLGSLKNRFIKYKN
ncbi:fumarylacetoacetate hydrolase family protein [Picrophilus oshimae]|uniref:2-keto-4-pentenoate hydratase/2-oxohepta-3-ene-1,7-dioic acid hydratase (Catechol pathway) n=1 Tax=Picrophilus torridus (strain ATCC 700027 / DSM 9790 / JCM 10055 / NBRC 100828 / KAW 2/3) TaxID=1122961 RepID=A0A8G2FXD6_PICTO|nr:fumarylacetoacetate hydrolase family protein [Picrophilus oshimae]SMD31262.1 2-keto-4-pentenoate hydratase/2-oxohepta-3-ene-1,7-dioic acid hydratase (catechol pathway) [Picrophilus oshimae DSM 9789]